MRAYRLPGLAVAVLLAAACLAPAGDAGDKVLRLFVEEFVPLTPGKGKFPASFRMGSAGAEAPASEKPVVEVRFRGPFAIAKYEVTQELYQLVMGKNPSKWKGRRNSVEIVSWNDANTFCVKVTERLRQRKLLADDEVIRLPSEAEWEYACRAGTTTKYSFGDSAADLGPYAWYKDNSKGHDPPVGRKKPNAWGLYDMHGYVWEWCADDWHPDHKGAATDGSPRKVKDSREKVVRGGSWADSADSARSAFRSHRSATFGSDRVGFRCVRAKRPEESK
jgi:formylglycine-generating enzyme required for sulfatase activity